MPVLQPKPDIIIAGASVRSLAESALRSGLKPICVDLFADSDLTLLLSEAGLPLENVRRVLDFKSLESAINDVSDSVPLLPVGGLEVCSEVLERIASRRQVLAMSKETIDFLKDPTALFSILMDAGYDVPKFVVRGAAFSQLADTSKTWLKKDAASSGGHHVERIDATCLSESLAALSPSEFLQQEAEGRPCSATFLVGADRHLSPLGCADQLCGEAALNASGFQFCGNVGPIQLPQTVTQQLLNIAATLDQHMRLQGVFGIDFLLDQDHVLPIEVNPRLTASHELHEQADSLVLQHSQAFAPDLFQSPSDQSPEPEDHEPRARMIVYSDRTFTVSHIAYSVLLQLRRSLQSRSPRFWISDIPAAGTIIEPGTPFCSLNFAAAGSELTPSVQRQLERLANDLPIIKSAEIAELLQDITGRY